MAASLTVPQSLSCSKSPISRTGVLTIHGFGVRMRMQSGHLEIESGIGPERRKIRLARIGSKLKRLVCVSEDGFITLSALKWLTDVGVSFVMLDRTGRILFVSGPTAPSDVRLRRSQALAHQNGQALEISCELIRVKLEGQERVVREQLKEPIAAKLIAGLRDRLAHAETLDTIRSLEAQAAAIYWNAWSDVPVLFPRRDEKRVPAHWLRFGARHSLLTGQPRLAVNPPNAILNYCFALAESECRLALCACGLDPSMGFIHVDKPYRDSLALDVLETVRPSIEAWLLTWIMGEPLRRSDFFETGTGNCRLMSRLCSQLSETAPTWGRLVAPWAEYVARTLWSSASQSRGGSVLPTRLTQQHRREAKGRSPFPPVEAPKPESICRVCGASISPRRKYCSECEAATARERMVEIAKMGRIAARATDPQRRMAATQRRHALARWAWQPSSLPAWLNEETYTNKIQPLLKDIANPVIMSALGVSVTYAVAIRAGRRRPHPRHWEKLAELVGVSVEAAITLNGPSLACPWRTPVPAQPESSRSLSYSYVNEGGGQVTASTVANCCSSPARVHPIRSELE